jgi:hypothetical protein
MVDDIRPVIPALLEAGVNLVMTMDLAAGMDLVEQCRVVGR